VGFAEPVSPTGVKAGKAEEPDFSLVCAVRLARQETYNEGLRSFITGRRGWRVLSNKDKRSPLLQGQEVVYYVRGNFYTVKKIKGKFYLTALKGSEVGCSLQCRPWSGWSTEGGGGEEGKSYYMMGEFT
jgi:hypothetical protein